MLRLQTELELPSVSLLDESFTAPANLGIFFFGLTFLLFNLCNTGVFPLNPLILALGVFYGAVGQILVGMLEWRNGRLFSAVALTSFGFFWLSLIALNILPRAGYGEAPEAVAMTAYLGLWTLFTLILTVATFQLSRPLQLVFISFFLYLLLSTVATTGINFLGGSIAGYEGIFGGIVALSTGILLPAPRQTGND